MMIDNCFNPVELGVGLRSGWLVNIFINQCFKNFSVMQEVPLGSLLKM